MKDLIVLVADIDIEFAMRGLLLRTNSPGIRQLEFDIYRHPHRDPGCRLESVDFLRPFAGQYRFALVMFDHEGSGAETTPPNQIAAELNEQFSRSGWDHRAATIILRPELEIWVWSDSLQVDAVLGWAGRQPSLRQWLLENQWISGRSSKPNRPKEAMRAALRIVRKVPSASLFEALARSVSFRGCSDPAFHELQAFLNKWFGKSARAPRSA